MLKPPHPGLHGPRRGASVVRVAWLAPQRQRAGVANDNGTPDLIAAIATNGKTGYVYARDLVQPAPTTLQLGTPPGETRTIPVYTSDGHTEIGQFLIGSPVDEADTR